MNTYHVGAASGLYPAYSAKELDAGTELLLEKLSTSLSGEILDFACSGVIASYIM